MTKVLCSNNTPSCSRQAPQAPRAIRQLKWKTVFVAFLLCAANTIGSFAQSLDTLTNFKDGEKPDAAFVRGKDGNLYGAIAGGGANGGGTISKLTSDGQLVAIYSFCSQAGCLDGGAPNGVVQGSDGNFYGTNRSGGVYSQWGTVFRLTPKGILTTLHLFQLSDGARPRGALAEGLDGSFYGTTYEGGVNTACFDGDFLKCGTVFKASRDGAFSVLYNFCSEPNCADGANPVAGLTLGSDGDFYGTTYTGGVTPECPFGCGTVFKLTPEGVLTTLHTFCKQTGCEDGSFPDAGLVQGKDGNFYGVTSQGGSASGGTAFRITPDGQLTTLATFTGPNGLSPNAGLILGRDNSFYGTTTNGGAHGAGVVFKMSSSGVLTPLYSFCSRGVYPWCSDGEFPNAGLVQGKDGKFYGSTTGRNLFPCTAYCGTIFSFGVGLNVLPASGPVGKKVTVAGLNMTGATKVTFHGRAAAFTPVSGTKITAVVPVGATTGPVKVTTPGGVLMSNVPFEVTASW